MTRFLPHFTMATALLLLVACASCRREADLERSHADEALAGVVAQYETEKTVNDSLLDIACRHFLKEEDSNEAMACKLFSGVKRFWEISMVNNKDKNDSLITLLPYFLVIDKHIDKLNSDYMKGMVQFYIGMIYRNNGVEDSASAYFRKELNYAYRDSNRTNIAIALQHYGISLFALNDFDSAFYYIEKAVPYVPYVKKRTQMTIMHNAIHYRKLICPDSDVPDYRHYVPMAATTLRDSCLVYSVLADYYMGQSEYIVADELIKWVINNTSDSDIKAHAYRRKVNILELQGMTDSALAVCKLIPELEIANLEEKQAKKVVETRGEYEIRLAHERSSKRIAFVISISLVIILTLLTLWTIKQRKVHVLENDILRFTLQMDEFRHTIEKQREMITIQSMEIINEKKKIQNDIKTIKGLQSSQKTLNEYIWIMLRHFLLLENDITYHERFYAKMMDLYSHSSPTRKHFVDSLNRIEGLTPREIIICIALYESKGNHSNLWYVIGAANKSAFWTAKSRIKTKLQNSKDKAQDITTLIGYFERKENP